MSVENKGKKKLSLRGVASSKRLRYGGFSLFMIIVVVAVIILVNVGVTAMDDNWGLKLDVTANKLFKISPQTTQIIKGLTEPIEFIALYQEASSVNTVTELLNRYRHLNPDMITVRVVDPVRNPTFANQFDATGTGVGENSVVVANQDQSRFRVLDQSDMYETEYDMTTYQPYTKAFIGEQALTNAVVFVSSENQQKLYFLTEHNEVPFSQYSSYIQAPIEQLNIEIGTVGITGISQLAPGDILIVNAPQRDLSPDERETLKAFLEAGGKMMYLRNGGDEELENFESLLSLYGVTVNHDLVVESDQSKNQQGNPTIIIPNMESNDITSQLQTSKLVPVFPYVSSFDISQIGQSGLTVTPFLTTSDTAFGKMDLDDPNVTPGDGDLPGPRTVGLTVEKAVGGDQNTMIVVLGNSLFISAQQFASYSGNGDLFFNSIRWMQGESSAISIVGKSMLGNSLNITTTAGLLGWAALCMLVIPLAFIAGGLVIWLRRRHL